MKNYLFLILVVHIIVSGSRSYGWEEPGPESDFDEDDIDRWIDNAQRLNDLKLEKDSLFLVNEDSSIVPQETDFCPKDPVASQCKDSCDPKKPGSCGEHGSCRYSDETKLYACACQKFYGGCICNKVCQELTPGCVSCADNRCIACDYQNYFKCPNVDGRCTPFCPDNCSGMACDKSTGVCQCDISWGGVSCNKKCSKYDPNCIECDDDKCTTCNFDKGYMPSPRCQSRINSVTKKYEKYIGCSKVSCECNKNGECDCEDKCRCYASFAGEFCDMDCRQIDPLCISCYVSDDKDSKGVNIKRCAQCNVSLGYERFPLQTKSASECLKQCDPGMGRQGEFCFDCGRFMKIKFKDTCKEFDKKSMCISRKGGQTVADLLKYFEKDKYDPLYVSLEPCIVKDPDENDIKSAEKDQIWRYTRFQTTEYYSLSVPGAIGEHGEVMKICLGAEIDPKSSDKRLSGMLVVQPCEFNTLGDTRELQLFKFAGRRCENQTEMDTYENGGFYINRSSKVTKQHQYFTTLNSDSTAGTRIVLQDVQDSSTFRWTIFEQHPISSC